MLNPSTSSNLSRHVQKQHAQLLPKNQTSNNQSRQMTLSLSRNQRLIPSFSQESFQNSLIKLFVVQDLPFLLLESIEFRELVQLMRPEARVIKADALKNRIMEKFIKAKVQMKSFFSSIDSKISFTTDIWTSPNDLAFMAITAHWISPDFVIRSMLMDFVELSERHSGLNIETAFSQSLIDFGVFDKKLAITLDNASNNDSFIDALMDRDPSFDKEHHIRCFGHILNLCAQQALEAASVEISGIRDYIKAIIHRPMRLYELQRDYEEAGGSNFAKPILDVKTRWNSTADMIIRAIRLKKGLSITMNRMFDDAMGKKRRKIARGVVVDDGDESFVEITEEDWSNLVAILELLNPLKSATEIMSGDSYPALNLVVPTYTALLNHLELLSNDAVTTMYAESDFIKDASKDAFNKLNKYYNISSELCTIATVLDPRLKLDFYKADKNPMAEDPEEIRAYVKSFYDKDYAPHDITLSQNPSPTKKPTLLSGFYKTSTTSDESEIDVYLSEPVIANHSNFKILDYWKINSARFPNLSRMARDYLAVPGTSTPSERAFSGGRQLITDFRCRLKGETVTACMLLKNWMRNGQWDDFIQPQLDNITQ
jgi:hypothetical protein